MAREPSQLPVQDGFRLRGESVSRLEAFVDAAFAFAVTMMVISVGPLPQSVSELMIALRHAPTFVARSREDRVISAPGFLYMLLGPALHWHHARFHELRKALLLRAGG